MYCDVIEKEVLFKFFVPSIYEDCIGIWCEKEYDSSNKPSRCYNEIECPKHIRYWFDGSPANEEQQEIIRKMRENDMLNYLDGSVEWLNKNKKLIVHNEETILTLKFHKTKGLELCLGDIDVDNWNVGYHPTEELVEVVKKELKRFRNYGKKTTDVNLHALPDLVKEVSKRLKKGIAIKKKVCDK